MSRDEWKASWVGFALSVLGIGAIISLGLAGRLNWYVHPRYVGFTLTMAVLGAAALTAACGVLAAQRAAESGDRPGRLVRVSRMVRGVALVLAAAWALVLLPPATLTADSTANRPLSAHTGAAAATAGNAEDPGAGRADIADEQRSMVDWSLVLRQHDASLLSGRNAKVLGFVTADADDPESVFIVTRFVITCCAVDAQPIGVPVYQPDWQRSIAVDDWVEVSGVFTENPSVLSAWPAALLPSVVDAVEQPEDPYVS